HDCLDALLNDFTKPTIIHASAAKASTIIDKYYAKTDDSKMYHLCMMLHPRYKGTYFIKAKWDIEWIDTANEMLCKEWEEIYKPSIDPSFLKSASE
ncbi:hypothetical protein BT96DRAFT_783326, partial [Gymnopus androsaceus JB14]